MAFILFFGISCFPKKTYRNHVEEVDRSCNPYYKYIKKNWEMNNDSLFVFVEPPDYDSTLHIGYEHFNKPCIVGLTKSEVLKFFGEPSLVVHNEFKYFRRKECFKKEEYRVGCAEFTIVFDGKTEFVVGVFLPTVITAPKF